MPAYSFQERFIPLIIDLSKDHTVRAERAGRSRHARPGESLYLYYGMRTKWCRKIGEATCLFTREIRITEKGVFFIGMTGDWYGLGTLERDIFAWQDGFRPEGTTLDNPAGAWDLMRHWWKQTHELPFQGVVIYWKDFQPTIKAT